MTGRAGRGILLRWRQVPLEWTRKEKLMRTKALLMLLSAMLVLQACQRQEANPPKPVTSALEASMDAGWGGG